MYYTHFSFYVHFLISNFYGLAPITYEKNPISNLKNHQKLKIAMKTLSITNFFEVNFLIWYRLIEKTKNNTLFLWKRLKSDQDHICELDIATTSVASARYNASSNNVLLIFHIFL